MTKALILIDEGTENSASEYKDWQVSGMEISDTNPGSTRAGFQSLKLQKTFDIDDSYARRYLSREFTWEHFESCTFWIYRPAGNFKDPTDTLQLRFKSWNDEPSHVEGISIAVGHQPADKWVQYTFTKNIFKKAGFFELYDSISVEVMEWYIARTSGERNDFLYVDGLEINYNPFKFLFRPAFLILVTFVGGFVVLILLHLSSNRKKQSKELMKKMREQDTVVVEKRIQCVFCGKKLKITEDMQYCRYCGQLIPRCRVCGFLIVRGDKLLKCPYCKALVHKTHLIEWIKIKGYCPVCGIDVKESRDFPEELLEQRITPLSKTFEMISQMDEKKRCSLCAHPLAVNAHYCPYCGVKIPQCIVCLQPIIKGEEFVNCPHCGSFAHRHHLKEWLKIKSICPYCRERLNDLNIPS